MNVVIKDLLYEYSIFSRFVHYFQTWQCYRFSSLSKEFQRIFHTYIRWFHNTNKWQRTDTILRIHHQEYQVVSFGLVLPFHHLVDSINGLYFHLGLNCDGDLLLQIKSYYGFSTMINLHTFLKSRFSINTIASCVRRLPPYLTQSNTWRSYLIFFINTDDTDKTIIIDYTDLSNVEVVMDNFISRCYNSPLLIRVCEFFNFLNYMTCSYPNSNLQELMKSIKDPLPQIKWFESFKHHDTVANYVYVSNGFSLFYYDFKQLRLVFEIKKIDIGDQFSLPFIFPVQKKLLISLTNRNRYINHFFVYHLEATNANLITTLEVHSNSTIVHAFYSHHKDLFIVIRDSLRHFILQMQEINENEMKQTILGYFDFSFPDLTKISHDADNDEIVYASLDITQSTKTDIFSSKTLSIDSIVKLIN